MRLNGATHLAELPAAAGTLVYSDIRMNLEAYRVMRGSREIHLSPTEFRLLRFLMQNPGCVFSRETLLGAVWADGAGIRGRTVDVSVRRLRRALNRRGEANPIRTVRLAGYALDAIPEAPAPVGGNKTARSSGMT